MKYLAFVRMGIVRARHERGELYGRMLFLPMILGVFRSLWTAVAESGMPTRSEPNDLVWYLAATEWIVLSPPLIFVDLQEDVRRGDIACALPRPVSYLGSMYCQALGMLVVRATALGLGLVLWAFVFTRQLPPLPALGSVMLYGSAAMALITAVYVQLGLAAFWVDDVTPLYWIWQKSLFLLGGLMIPLELYPTWFRRLSELTPFPSLLSAPASFLTTHVSLSAKLTLAAKLGCWSLAVAGAGAAVFAAVTRRLEVRGG